MRKGNKYSREKSLKAIIINKMCQGVEVLIVSGKSKESCPVKSALCLLRMFLISNRRKERLSIVPANGVEPLQVMKYFARLGTTPSCLRE